MEESGKRRTRRMASIAAGSVWDSRMKNDQVKGGIKFFNGQEDHQVKQPRLTRAKNDEKPKTRHCISEKSTIAMGTDTELSESDPADPRQGDKACHDTDPSSDSILDDTIVGNGTGAACLIEGRGRGQRPSSCTISSSNKNTRLNRDANNHNPGSPSTFRVTGLKKTRSEPPLLKAADSSEKAWQVQVQAQSPLIRKMKSEPNRAVNFSNPSATEEVCDPCSSGKGNSNSNSQTEKVNCTIGSTPTRSASESGENINEKTMEFNPLKKLVAVVALRNSDDHKQIESGQEEALIPNPATEVNIKASPDPEFKSQGLSESESILVVTAEEGLKQKLLQESKSCGGNQTQDACKVIASGEPIPVGRDGDEKELVGDGADNASEIEIDVGNTNIGAKKALDTVKEINNAPETKTTMVVSANKSKPHVVKKSSSITSSRKSFPTLKKPIPSSPRPINKSAKSKESISQSSDEFCRILESHGRLQSLVNLVMWRDVSRSAFVFGIGTFIIISSSYAKDLNISLISAGSYVALVYLAIMFFYRSIMFRGIIYEVNSPEMNLLGEEEALWVLKFILPYLNEFLLKMRGLFSGDPAVTMKLALMLFVLARCGSSFTIWKVIKLGFFGVFVIPKFCSSYSTPITAYGKFWVGRFQDAWRSCSHKKVVAFAIFTLVWNCSSLAARAWAAFMLFVALRYYQQSLDTADDCVEHHSNEMHYLQHRHIWRQHRSNMPTIAVHQDQDQDQRKDKKSF